MADFITQIPEYAFPHELDRIFIRSTDTVTVEFYSDTGIELQLTLTPDKSFIASIDDFARVLRDATATKGYAACEIYASGTGGEFIVRACRQDIDAKAVDFYKNHFFSLCKGTKPTYMGAKEVLYAASINTATATLVWINAATGDVQETTVNLQISGDDMSARIDASPSKFTAPADGYALHSYTINADGRIARFVLRTCADATPVTLQFKNCFGYLETFHCFGNSITELKPTRSSASFLGKTRNYRVLAIPETTAHTGVISPDLFDMFADLCASTSVSVLPSDREICITDCDFKLSNDRYEPQ